MILRVLAHDSIFLQAVAEKPSQETQEASVAHVSADAEAVPALQAQESVLADSEVRRRLRRLGHPVTLFAEENSDRYARLRHVERTLEVHDEEAGGGEMANVLHTIAKEDRLKAQAAANQSSTQRSTDVPTPPKTSAHAEVDAQVCLPCTGHAFGHTHGDFSAGGAAAVGLIRL